MSLQIPARGAPVNISGTAYPRKPKPRKIKAATSSRKRKATSSALISAGPAKRVRGSGDYTLMDGRTKSYTPFGSVGQKLGSFFGAPGIGWAAGHLLGRVVGSGDYMMSPFPVNNNILVNGRELPKFAQTKFTNVVCHREYIRDIVSSSTPGAFKVEAFNINPGNKEIFPWISRIAQNYEQYKIHGMIFEFKTTSSDALNSTNTALGEVIMSTDYDPVDANYVNKQQMSNAEYGQSAKPSLSQMHAIECDAAQTPLSQLYIRTGSVPPGQDRRFYDFAKFQIATDGLQGANVKVGELWVTYCIEFFKPQLEYTKFQKILAFEAGCGTNNPVGYETVDSKFENNLTLASVRELTPLGSPYKAKLKIPVVATDSYLVLIQYRNANGGFWGTPAVDTVNCVVNNQYNPGSGVTTGIACHIFRAKAIADGFIEFNIKNTTVPVDNPGDNKVRVFIYQEDPDLFDSVLTWPNGNDW